MTKDKIKQALGIAADLVVRAIHGMTYGLAYMVACVILIPFKALFYVMNGIAEGVVDAFDDVVRKDKPQYGSDQASWRAGAMQNYASASYSPSPSPENDEDDDE